MSNIFDLLKSDHDKLRVLLNELVDLQKDDSESRNVLVGEIRDSLIPHSRAEESVFYNSLRALASDTHPVWHGYSEHLAAESLLRTLQAEDGLNMKWKETAYKLKASLEHHIQEEESEIFSLARRVLSESEGEMLANAFQKLKYEVKDQNILTTSLEMVANMMPPRLAKFLGSSSPAGNIRQDRT